MSDELLTKQLCRKKTYERHAHDMGIVYFITSFDSFSV